MVNTHRLLRRGTRSWRSSCSSIQFNYRAEICKNRRRRSSRTKLPRDVTYSSRRLPREWNVSKIIFSLHDDRGGQRPHAKMISRAAPVNVILIVIERWKGMAGYSFPRTLTLRGICSKASTRGILGPHLVSRDGWNLAPLSRSPPPFLLERGKHVYSFIVDICWIKLKSKGFYDLSEYFMNYLIRESFVTASIKMLKNDQDWSKFYQFLC